MTETVDGWGLCHPYYIWKSMKNDCIFQGNCCFGRGRVRELASARLWYTSAFISGRASNREIMVPSLTAR